jgi:ectoine hydroxylase-related dioxygenase (phytanoyl-CoA dioxygenase family)
MKSSAARTLRDQYEREGYCIFRNVIDEALLAETRAHVAWLIRKYPHKRPEDLSNDLVMDDPFRFRLVKDPRLLDIAEQFIGPNIALFGSHCLCKPPGDGLKVLWHQDGSYWPLHPMEMVSLWLAVDDSVRENGCMRVIPGTHTRELSKLEIHSIFTGGMADSLVDEARAVDIELRAGDVSIHHPNVIHGSNANTSTRRRCGIVIRYIPTTTRITSELVDNLPHQAFLLRGQAVPGINTYHPLPKYRVGVHLAFQGCDNPL